MKVVTYNQQSIDFPKLNNTRDRLEFVIDRILEDEELAKYYNPLSIHSKDLTNKQFEEIENRWLGIKVVGKPDKKEHIKGFLDYLTGYILNGRDLSHRFNIRRFYRLTYTSELNEEEAQEFNELKKQVIYADLTRQGLNDSVIFMRNFEIEDLLKARVIELEQKSDRDYSEDFILYNIKERLLRTKEIVDEIYLLKNKIDSSKSMIEITKEELKESFRNKDFNKESYIGKADYIKELKSDINYYRELAKERTVEYMICTELMQVLE